MTSPGQFVCGDCINNDGIRRFISDNAAANSCSFCQVASDGPVAAPLDDVGGYINRCLREEYGDASDGLLPWDSEDKDFAHPNWDSEDLLACVVELDLPNDGDNVLMDKLVGYLDEIAWCERNGLGLTDREYAQYSWEYLCEVVMHQRRFFFLDYGPHPYEPDIYDPGQVLRDIFGFARETGLFKVLPAGTLLFRARWEQPGSRLETPQELGPPPENIAVQANRMSPPGVVMFYSSHDIETALLEAAAEPGRFAVGLWKLLRPATVLDLTAIPVVPELFEYDPEDGQYLLRRALIFLHHVAEQMSQPVARDERVHVDYVPTQVVTEFLRARVRWQGNRTDGIRYSSSVHPGHASYALFATQDHIVGGSSDSQSEEAPWLELVGVCHSSVDFPVQPPN